MACKYDLSASEYDLMQLFWDSDKEYTVADATNFYNSLGKTLSPSTIKTFLIRLVQKGALKTRKFGHKLMYSRSMTKSEYGIKWTEKFLQDNFDGLLGQFIRTLTGGKNLTFEQQKELSAFWHC